MVKVMYNEKLLYNVYIWVLFGNIFGKEKETLTEGPRSNTYGNDEIYSVAYLS